MQNIQSIIDANTAHNNTLSQIARLVQGGHVRYSAISTNYQISPTPATMAKADIVLRGNSPIQFHLDGDILRVTHSGTPTTLYAFIDDLN